MTIAEGTRAAYDTTFSRNAAENYERYFVPSIGRPFAVDLVAGAGLQAGERVLDVACGTGIVARLAAEHVTGVGAVSGVDINPAMLGVARSLPSAIPVKWYETTAESAPLPDASFDVVFCQMGLQFFANKPAALREMRRVLAPGGRLHISTPMPNGLFDVLDRAIARHVSDEASAFVHAVFAFDDPEEMRVLLSESGFDGLDVRPHTKTLTLPAPRDFMWQYINCTPLMALVPPADDPRAKALEAEVVAGWRPWAVDGGMRYEQSVLVGSARAQFVRASVGARAP
jgi:ubiquinone/menaquinone biosynthesis C-methylase UbiE